MLSHDAVVFSVPETQLARLLLSKLRHLSVGKYYHFGDRVMLGLFPHMDSELVAGVAGFSDACRTGRRALDRCAGANGCRNDGGVPLLPCFGRPVRDVENTLLQNLIMPFIILERDLLR